MHAACLTALLAGGITIPSPLFSPVAQAAESCRSHVAAYVMEATPGTGWTNVAKPRLLRKYVDWDPKNGDTNGTMLDTGKTAQIPYGSRVFTGGQGVIYEITNEGVLKSYKDKTDTGGSLLAPARTYDVNWTTRKRVWSNGSRIFSVHEGGKLEVFKQSDPATGAGTVSLLGTLPSDRPGVLAFKNADDVWAAGNRIFTLKDGEIRAWDYREEGTIPVLPDSGVLLASGLTDAVNGWSPGPGSVYTATSARDYSGIVRSYTGTTALALANDDVMTGLYGDVFADTASCLVDAPDTKPLLGSMPTETETPPPAVTDDTAGSEPVDPAQFSGKFVLGDGRPAAGMTVRVEADNVTEESATESELTTLGTATTASDGTWKLELPATLPASVSSAAAENGGAVNAMASVMGKTSTGVPMRGVDHVTAAPATAPATAQALAATAAEDSAKPAPVLPLVEDTAPQPTEQEYTQSWGAQQEALAQDTLGDSPLPMWQSDVGNPSNADPYMVGGVDTKRMSIEPYDGGCDKTSEKVVDKKTYYTTVAEGHAYWDAKASVDYDQKLASNMEVAVKTGSNWSIQGSVTLGSSMSVTTGYTNRGPHFAKQWKVPIQYKKIKMIWKCGGGNTFTQYKIQAGKYHVPAGGATGKYGKDVRNKDGMTAYYNSPKSHRAYVERGAYFQLSKNRSIKWSGAVTAFGVTLGGSTQFDREHKQRITAGMKTGSRHDIWGKNDRVSGKPGIFFSF
ncbi:hypothetical protein [Streptomyces sp. NRRL B-1140]|uniref:hypothetical protein n=1 Tax=Streptomyces sp. NRRL B-1140 TaxID=1415549 RepID=UPI000A92CEB8|nr:hypothetical protein [Streptomyces sp. NRRL B-1140]